MKVFELFSGVGGMHFAFKESGISCHIERALDINTVANHVYKENFPDTVLMENNVQSLTEDIFNELDIEIISMSPPCQPFTRVGHQKGSDDKRCDALTHLLALIPKLNTLKYVILENVVGFEKSSTRDNLISVLKASDFRCQEFILSPTQFYIPNSRTRYYLLAKKNSLNFCFEENPGVITDLPHVDDPDTMALINKFKEDDALCFKVKKILDEKDHILLPDKVLTKYAEILDIVTEDSRKTCCFTKAYTHYAKGTGSVFCPRTLNDIQEAYKDCSFEKIKNLNMRYFTPTEVARLMCFPESFKFPSDLGVGPKYRLLGNSINVHVVSILIRLLIL